MGYILNGGDVVLWFFLTAGCILISSLVFVGFCIHKHLREKTKLKRQYEKSLLKSGGGGFVGPYYQNSQENLTITTKQQLLNILPDTSKFNQLPIIQSASGQQQQQQFSPSEKIAATAASRLNNNYILKPMTSPLTDNNFYRERQIDSNQIYSLPITRQQQQQQQQVVVAENIYSNSQQHQIMPTTTTDPYAVETEQPIYMNYGNYLQSTANDGYEHHHDQPIRLDNNTENNWHDNDV